MDWEATALYTLVEGSCQFVENSCYSLWKKIGSASAFSIHLNIQKLTFASKTKRIRHNPHPFIIVLLARASFPDIILLEIWNVHVARIPWVFGHGESREKGDSKFPVGVDGNGFALGDTG